jgi:serine/threonine protein kinase
MNPLAYRSSPNRTLTPIPATTVSAATATPVSLGPAPIFAVDTVLDGTYRIVSLLGQGGMGEVYLAAHERLPGYFAVKAMQPDLASHAESVGRFRREAEILAGLRHPNVVQVVDFNVSAQGAPYLVMELIDGQDLDSELRQGQQLSPSDVIALVRQIASALDAAHAAGVVHRDLKPANLILVRAPGQTPIVKVIDFGISISEWSNRLTTESQIVGTPEYMSPEQALGRRDEIDGRSDQFALAALTHTLLARRPPFRGDTPLATLSAIVNGEPETLAPYVSWPAGEVEEVLRKGMARSRDDRYPSVLDLTDALEAALDRSGALAEPARACPSATATGSGSGPALALTTPAHRTPARARHVTPRSGSVVSGTIWQPSVEPVGGSRADKRSRASTEFVTSPSPPRPRKLSAAISLLALLTLGVGLVTARSLRPLEFQRGVAMTSGALRTGWTEASAMLGQVPPALQRLRLSWSQDPSPSRPDDPARPIAP